MAAGKTKAGVAKRASTRTVVVSKSMRKVDEETRNEVRDRRLQMLEADNYVEAEIASQGDDAYDEDDNTSDFKKKKKARVDGGSKSKSSSISKWAARRNKSLERVVVEQGYDQGKAYDLFASSTDAQIVLCGRYPSKCFMFFFMQISYDVVFSISA